MCSLSNVTGKEFIKFVESIGYRFSRQNRGNHRIYIHEMKKPITIPVYKKKVLKKGLISGLLKDVGIPKSEFIKIIHKNKKEI